MINHPNRSRGKLVENRLDGRIGELVKGPRRASAGMVWVLWEDREAPVLWNRLFLRRLPPQAEIAE